jgi:hypothetical protein
MVLHVTHDMKANVALKLDADLLREARVMAAEDGSSVSALLTNRLEGSLVVTADARSGWLYVSGGPAPAVLQSSSVLPGGSVVVDIRQ